MNKKEEEVTDRNENEPLVVLEQDVEWLTRSPLELYRPDRSHWLQIGSRSEILFLRYSWKEHLPPGIVEVYPFPLVSDWSWEVDSIQSLCPLFRPVILIYELLCWEWTNLLEPFYSDNSFLSLDITNNSSMYSSVWSLNINVQTNLNKDEYTRNIRLQLASTRSILVFSGPLELTDFAPRATEIKTSNWQGGGRVHCETRNGELHSH